MCLVFSPVIGKKSFATQVKSFEAREFLTVLCPKWSSVEKPECVVGEQWPVE
jgi:hypothetical protein